MALALKQKKVAHYRQSAEKFALLTIGDLYLTLPQADVVTIELVTTVIAFSRQGSKAAGFIEYEGSEWPVYSLSPEFRLRRYVPQKRRFCVCFGKDKAQAFALLCDDIRLLPDTGDNRPRDLPDCMLTNASPLRKLLWMNDHLVVMTELSAMHVFLEQTHVDD
jgi:hypothetical protein